MADCNPSVFVASVVPRLASAVRNLLPAQRIVEIKLDAQGNLSEIDTTNIKQNAEILFADIPVINAVAGESMKLKWAQSTWAGVERILQRFPEPPSGVTITRMGGGFGTLIAEYVIGHIISNERHFTTLLDAYRQKIWITPYVRERRMLSSLTVGILGVGQIGSEISRTVRNFGMKTIGLCRSPRMESSSPDFDLVISREDLPKFLQDCDYLVNILPSTASTINLLSGDVLSHCSKKPFFINVGRGDIIDDASLIKAIEQGWLSGAVLDVVKPEPLPADSPLWNLSNVLITPHISGPCIAEPISVLFARNYNNYIKGRTLEFQINWEAGY